MANLFHIGFSYWQKSELELYLLDMIENQEVSTLVQSKSFSQNGEGRVSQRANDPQDWFVSKVRLSVSIPMNMRNSETIILVLST